MARSLNRVQLIGNLTRDPELRYTPAGTAVCSFSLATNRQWKTDTGEPKEEAEFHRIVAWNKLAEICSQMLHKGNRAYVDGRIQSRTWTGQDGQQRTTYEIVISDMITLEKRVDVSPIEVPEELEIPEEIPHPVEAKGEKTESKKKEKESPPEDNDIPF